MATLPSIIDILSGLLGASIFIFISFAVLEPLESQRAEVRSQVSELSQRNTSSGQGWNSTSVRVIDGDTLEIAGTRFRLYGFDAPEMRQICKDIAGRNWACGQEVTHELQKLIRASERVTCDGAEKDRYGRTIAICYADGIDTGSHLVSKGLAWAYVQYSDRYIGDERSARRQGLGIWQAYNIPAWDLRREN